jgi:glucosamine--fructose-6-phosphate aminotransferase (isomerizing)
MCGIVAYVGPREAYPILIKGLKRLEYRGYDSAGVALLNTTLNIYKTKGKVSDLEHLTEGKNTASHLGMGHTRWATHGEPNDINSHPHLSQDGELAIIHNGIIENYGTLKEMLIKQGHNFKSDTDTEVLIHLIEEIKKSQNVDLDEAVRIALHEIVGAYAIVIISRNDNNKLIGARKGSPMVVGIGEDGEYFIASDASPIIEYTKNVTYLNDGEIAYINDGKLTIKTIGNIEMTPAIHKLEMNLEAIEKGGYEHFMIKEIFEQPKSIHDSLRGRFNTDTATLAMRSLKEYEHKIKNLNRIIIIGCGTSWHAGLVGEYLFEDIARIPVEVEYASEFRYRNPVINENDLVIAISQSGETADTLAAIQLAKEKGATIFGLCNVVGSSIPRASHAGAYTHAGPEIGVASTKAFTAQVSVLTLLALGFADIRGTITKSDLRQVFAELETMPAKVEKTLKCEAQIKEIAYQFYESPKFLVFRKRLRIPGSAGRRFKAERDCWKAL